LTSKWRVSDTCSVARARKQQSAGSEFDEAMARVGDAMDRVGDAMDLVDNTMAGLDDSLDDLDRMLTVWSREIPALDPLTEGIVERLSILDHDFGSSLDETLASLGLDRRSYHLLGWLRAAGPPYRRTPGQLARGLRLSSGAMTNRLDRMEEAGLIRRLPDPSDRRGVLVEPTEKGHAAWDRAVDVQAQREALLASVLDKSEREELHRLLRRLMRAFPSSRHAAKVAQVSADEGEPSD
jgi:DNA-binding MarR family transcriptional regulator